MMLEDVAVHAVVIGVKDKRTELLTEGVKKEVRSRGTKKVKHQENACK